MMEGRDEGGGPLSVQIQKVAGSEKLQLSNKIQVEPTTCTSDLSGHEDLVRLNSRPTVDGR